MYYRPDFMSCTAVAIGIYAVMNPHNITRQLFRILVVFLFITFIYDFIFLIFIHNSESEDQADSNLAVNVRRFAYFFAWISFAFRPIVMLIIWKDSLDFRKIIRQKSEMGGGSIQGGGMSSEELELHRIM